MPQAAPLPLAQSALLFQHLAAMEKAGVPAERAYALLDLGPSARERCALFRRLVKRGKAPPEAGLSSGLFSLFDTRLLRAAFAAGSPLPVYQRLAAHYASRSTQRMQIRSRMLLPLSILVLALFVAPLPAVFSGAITAVGYAARVLGPLAVLALLWLAAGTLRARFLAGTALPGRALIESTLLALPVFGPAHLRRCRRDFAESLGLMLHAGLTLFEALPAALGTVGNAALRADLASVQPSVQAGATLASALGALDATASPELTALVLSGEESGTLPEMLTHFAHLETAALERFQKQAVEWGPRLFYALVALWMVRQLLGPVVG